MRPSRGPSSQVDTDDLVAAMLETGFYEHAPASVELHETEISWVFIADELAYKVKKPLRLPFLDYGTLQGRRQMCRREVQLNQRLAPEYYLGVRSIVTTARGPGDAAYGLDDEDASGAVEFAVEMRPIPQEKRVDGLIADGRFGSEEVNAIAQRLARFHRREAKRAGDPPVAVEHQLDALEENLTTLRASAGDLIPASRLRAAEHFTSAFLASGGRQELARRAVAGLVRDGHGDIRAEHVLMTSPVQVFDCIEFSAALRQIDVAADLAFLTMDLERLGGRGLAETLLVAYRKAGGDPGDRRLHSFLASYRAWVRAKVALLGPAEGREIARAYHALGHRLAWRARLPLVLVVCGTAASGKSTLVRALRRLSGLEIVAADSTRKRLAGLRPTERGSPEHYTAEYSRRTYHELGAAAADALDRSGGVIIDATARRAEDRKALRDGLAGREAPLIYAECGAPDSVLLDRARKRERDEGRTSDADVEVVRSQLGSFEPLRLGVDRHARIDTTLAVDEQVSDVEALLDRGALGVETYSSGE